jgi:hypothetical protein
MTVNLLNGSHTTFNLSSVLNMTFTSGSFNVKSSSITYSYPLTNFKNLKFSPGVYTAVIAETNDNSINVFPNPVKNNLIVNLSGPIAQGASIRIFSIEGKLMKSQPISSSSTTLDLSDLYSGLYFCSYLNGSESKTIKIIKE